MWGFVGWLGCIELLSSMCMFMFCGYCLGWVRILWCKLVSVVVISWFGVFWFLFYIMFVSRILFFVF